MTKREGINMKISKKILCILLSVIMFVSSNAIVMLAESMDDVMVGTEGINHSERLKDGFFAPIDEPDASAIKIASASDFSKISENPYGSYVLTNDIDMSDAGSWTPIANSMETAFHGKIDGQGFSIKGLTISQNVNAAALKGVKYSVGFLGIADGAEIKNLNFENVNIVTNTTSGYTYSNSLAIKNTFFAGAIVGYACNNTIVFNCHVSGKIHSKASGEACVDTVAGGLVGYGENLLMSYCYNHAEVIGYDGNALQAQSAFAGGIVGRTEAETIMDRCYNAGSITAETLDYGNAYVGGLVGYSNGNGMSIQNSFNEGTIKGLSGNQLSSGIPYAGGIVGKISGSIDKVYNSGVVSAIASDPYGICNTTAYVGGISGISDQGAKIENSAIVQSTVSASVSGTKYQYRIAYGGEKNNNITIDLVVKGSNNDANMLKTDDELTIMSTYADILGWDFESIWTMQEGKDYPQIKQVDISSEEYDQDYIDMHVDFIRSQEYRNIIDEYRWSQIYWSEENNFVSNTNEVLYKTIDGAINLASFNFKDLFDDNDPYKIILSDYISDHTTQKEVINLYKVKLPFALDKKYKKVEKFIRANWKDEYGKLNDEDVFYLFHYDKKTGEEWINQDFEKNLQLITYDDKSLAFENVLGVTTECFNTIIEQKANLDHYIDWLNGLINYSAEVDAYVEADNEFKMVLEEMCNNLPDENAFEHNSKQHLEKALKSYIQYNSSEGLREKLFLNYIGGTIYETFENKLWSVMGDIAKKWLQSVLSANAFNVYTEIVKVADKTWKVMEYVTKNGELMECRELLRANAYFEETLFRTMRKYEQKLTSDSNFETACLFDASYKFFKEVEIASIDIIIRYFETYQTSMLQAIRNKSNTFMNSAIEEAIVNKLFLYRSYCHGLKYKLGTKVITIACPTDVYLYGEDGVLLTTVENNTIKQDSEELVVVCINGVKMIALPTEQEYSLEIIGNDDGFMNYVVSEYNDQMIKEQCVLSTDIEIKKDQVFKCTINTELSTNPQNYNLTNDGEIVPVNECVNKDSYVVTTDLNMNLDATNMEVGDSQNIRLSYEPSNATTTPVMWFSSDHNVVSIDEKGTITAKAVGKAVIIVSLLDGSISKAVEITVLEASCKEHVYDEGIVAKEPTCSSTGIKTYTCESCNKTYEEVLALNSKRHENVEKNAINKKEATCKETGYTGDSMCIACGEIVAYDGEIVEKNNNHVTTVVGRIEATKEKEGYSGDQVCSICEQTIVKGEIIEKLPNGEEDDNPSKPDENVMPSPTVKPNANSKITYKIGDIVEDNEQVSKYQITRVDTQSAEVVYLGTTDGNASIIKIPETIVINNMIYKVTKIADKAFKNNKKLTKITIGSKITVIGKEAFSGCSKLKSVTIGKNVTSIGDKAFYKCGALTRITIPSKVSKIGKSAFYRCKKMKTVTIKSAKLKSIGGNSFKGMAEKSVIKIPKSKMKTYKKLLNKKYSTKNTIVK